MEPKFDLKPIQQETLAQKEQRIVLHRTESFLKAVEESVFKGRGTLSNKFVADLEKKLNENKSAGIDLSSIKNLEARVEKLRQEAGTIAVRSCLEKAQLAAQTKYSDPLLAASWFYQTSEKLKECKNSIPPSELALIQGEMRELEANLSATLGEYDRDKVAKEEDEEIEKKLFEFSRSSYETSIEKCERYIKAGEIAFARSELAQLEKDFSEDIIKHPFLVSVQEPFEKRFNLIREKLAA